MIQKQKKLLKNVASRKFKTVRAAAVDAGYSPHATNGAITKAIQSTHKAYLNALIKAGATDQKSARVISEAMDAEKVEAIEDMREDENGDPTGRREVFVKTADHGIRIKANEQFLKVKKLMLPEIGDGEGGLVPLVVYLPQVKKDGAE